MKQYKVFMKVTSYQYATFEANSKAEARRMAEDADGSVFRECPDPKWRVAEVIREDS